MMEFAKAANTLLRQGLDAESKQFRWNAIYLVPVDGKVLLTEASLAGRAVNVVVGGDDCESVLVKRDNTANYVRNG